MIGWLLLFISIKLSIFVCSSVIVSSHVIWTPNYTFHPRKSVDNDVVLCSAHLHFYFVLGCGFYYVLIRTIYTVSPPEIIKRNRN